MKTDPEQHHNRYKNPYYAEKLRRMCEWIKGDKPLPFKIAMIPTNRCNFSCFFCPNSVARSSGRFKPEDELSTDDWLSLVDQGLEMGVNEWRFLGGGEPLVRYDATLSMLYKIKDASLDNNCEIITNGFLFKAEDIRKLVELNMDRIIFSIHGSDKETQEYLSGVHGSFDRVTENLLLFKKMKEEFGTDKPVIQINSVITNRSYDKVVEIVNYAKRVGGNELAIHPMRSYGEISSQIQHLVLTPGQEKAMLGSLENAKSIAAEDNLILDLAMVEETYTLQPQGQKRTDDNINKDESAKGAQNDLPDDKNGFVNKFLNARCYEPFYGMLICPEGRASHCIPHGMGIEGLDVRKLSLKDIWFSEYFERIRKNVFDGVMMECCLKCGLLDMSKELRDDLRLFVKERCK